MPNLFICITDIVDNPIVFVADNRAKIIVKTIYFEQNFYWLDLKRELYFAYYQVTTDSDFFNTLNLENNRDRYMEFLKSLENYNDAISKLLQSKSSIKKLYLHRKDANRVVKMEFA